MWGSVDWVQLRSIRGGGGMSDLLTWVWNVYYFIDGVSWLFGVIAVGFIGVVVGLRKLMVYFWPELDTSLNKALRAAKNEARTSQRRG